MHNQAVYGARKIEENEAKWKIMHKEIGMFVCRQKP